MADRDNSYWRNKVAFVTGAGSGIGKGLAKELTRLGAKVYMADINNDLLTEAAEDCGLGAESMQLDVRDLEEYKRCINLIIKKGHQIDFLFNNAGIGLAGEAKDFEPEAWHQIIDVNIKGVANGVAIVYPMMVKQRSGHIINTSSLSGVSPSALFTPYAMTKYAIVGLSNSLRLEGKKHGVRVSVLCPGAIDTPLLDNANPVDVTVGSEPDVRKYMTKVTGDPVSPDLFAQKVLKEIEKNKGMIFYPKKAKEIWKIGRYFPSLLSKLGDKALEEERKNLEDNVG